MQLVMLMIKAKINNLNSVFKTIVYKHSLNYSIVDSVKGNSDQVCVTARSYLPTSRNTYHNAFIYQCREFNKYNSSFQIVVRVLLVLSSMRKHSRQLNFSDWGAVQTC